MDYRGQSILNLFSVLGLTAGTQQRVTIVEVLRNHNRWRDYFLFCEFVMKQNPYVENKTLSPCWEICFNGDCVLNIGIDRQHFEFFPYYLSNKREDFIFNNRHVAVGSEHDYWCSSICSNQYEDNHTNKHGNEPYMPIYRELKKYEFGCFGCSITRGTGLKKGSEWPALLNSELGPVINLAEESLGPDGIFLNLRCALKEFQLARVIILWPDLNRACFRWNVGGWHSRVPLSSRIKVVPAPDAFGVWHTYILDDYNRFVSRFLDGCISGRESRRGQRIISRTIKFLKNREVPAWHSSWSEETYSHLRSVGLGSALLPPFPRSDYGAMDGSHPSVDQQGSWYKLIREQIGSVDGRA